MKERKQLDNLKKREVDDKMAQKEVDSKYLTNEEERQRVKVAKLEQQIGELREELARANDNRLESGNVENVDLEVRLQTAEARAEAI